MAPLAQDPWQEPARGEALAPAAFALDGLDRARGWGRRWQPVPMFHLLGVRVTQVVGGSAVASMPVTPWLQHPDGTAEMGILADSVCSLAADTVLKPRTMLVPLHAGYRPLRMVPDDGRMLVGRASVVRTSADWVYVEGQVEDGEGRAIAHVSLHQLIRPVPFPVPDDVPEIDSQPTPSYPTPDPYRRPVPPEKFQVIERFHEEGVIPTLRAMARGEAPLPPIYALLGIRPVDVTEGLVTTELTTSPWLRSVHPDEVNASYLRTQAISTAIAAIWSITPPGHWPAALNFSTTIVATPAADGRRVTATATAERLGDDMARAVIETSEGGRRLAVSEVTTQLRPVVRQRAARPTRSVATVLFTDLVGSTASAERLGDAAWRRLLERHQLLVRAHLDEHGGREVKTTGDGFLATFDAPTAAVRCASAIRDDLRRLGVEIRAGIHAGEVEQMGGDVAGIAVHVAARVESAAQPGEVWASETVRSLTLGSGLTFVDRGLHALKGIDGDVRLYSVESTEQPTPSRG